MSSAWDDDCSYWYERIEKLQSRIRKLEGHLECAEGEVRFLNACCEKLEAIFCEVHQPDETELSGPPSPCPCCVAAGEQDKVRKLEAVWEAANQAESACACDGRAYPQDPTMRALRAALEEAKEK